MGRKRGALLVIVAVTALVVLTVVMSVSSWRDRVNPSVVNQAPATQQPQPSNR